MKTTVSKLKPCMIRVGTPKTKSRISGILRKMDPQVKFTSVRLSPIFLAIPVPKKMNRMAGRIVMAEICPETP